LPKLIVQKISAASTTNGSTLKIITAVSAETW